MKTLSQATAKMADTRDVTHGITHSDAQSAVPHSAANSVSNRALYNATIEIYRENSQARIFRVFPDSPRLRYIPGQYGSLGLNSSSNPEKLIKRAYSLSSSMVDLQTGLLLDEADLNYYEMYINRFECPDREIERLTPQLFELPSGSRVFCGTKIVGHYTLAGVDNQRNLLLIGSGTGESPNNSLAHQALVQSRPIKIANVALPNAIVSSPTASAVEPWRSLYLAEHGLMMDRFENYRYLSLTNNPVSDYSAFEETLQDWLSNPQSALAALGFTLEPSGVHVFVCGDPLLIGAPKKLGGWNYEYPSFGVFRLLVQHGFQLKTKFQDGNLEYETYW